MKIRVVSRGRGERGAVMVLTALFMSVLAIFAGGTMAAVTLYGANQEGRRAADLSALAAAASLPTLNLTACADNDTICNPLHLPNGNQVNTYLGDVDLNGAVPLPNLNWTTGACHVADKQFEDTRSPINQVFATGNAVCSAQPQYSQPWMQMIADCVQNLSSCTGVQNSLNAILPGPLSGPLATAVQNALTAADSAQELVTGTMMSTLNTLNNQTGILGFCFAFGGPGCLTPLINALGGDKLKLAISSISPALLTPQVKVNVRQTVDVPGAALVGLGNSTINNTATARRSFKNAVLLPAVGPKRPDGTYVINPNQQLANAADLTITALGLMDQAVSPLVQQALTPIVCNSNPTPCQIPSLLGDQINDLKDLFDPPGDQPPPDGNAILAEAVQNARPVLIATLGQVVRPQDVLNNTLWGLLAPLLGLGVGDLLVAPALDFMPATLQNGGSLGYIATPVRTLQLAGQTQGLYRARLVD